jgi:hypothetical protein
VTARQLTDRERADWEREQKLARTLPDEVAKELVEWNRDELIDQVIAAHESWEKWRDEMGEARYQDEVKIIPALRAQVEKLTDMLKALDESFTSCHCEGGGHEEGPYWVECPACLGYSRHMEDSRKLYALASDVHYMLYPPKDQEQETPPED